MIVKKFRGSNKDEAEKKAKQSMGEDAIILMNKLVKRKGIFTSGDDYEVTVAVEDKPMITSSEGVSGDSLMLSVEARRHMKGTVLPRKEEGSKDQDKALEALRKRRAGKLEVSEIKEKKVVSSGVQDIKAYIRNEMMSAHETVDPELTRKGGSPFLSFLLSRGIQQITAASIDARLKGFFGNINLAQPSDERTECFKMLKREISAKISVHGPICLDRYRTTYACFLGDQGSGKFFSAAKLAIQYTVALDKKVGIISLGSDLESKPVMTLDTLEQSNVGYKRASSLKDLSLCVDQLADCDLVILCYERSLSSKYDDRSLLEGIKHLLNGVSFHLVVNALNSLRSLENSIREFSNISLDSLVVTRLDKLENLGKLVDLCEQTKIPLSYLSTGYSVPEDLKIADKQELSKKILLDENYSVNKVHLSRTA